MANVIAQKHASRARGTDRSSAASMARARRKAVPDTRQLNFDL